jgi:hypothetical protein
MGDLRQQRRIVLDAAMRHLGIGRVESCYTQGMTTEIEWAWLAGFIEGEGTFQVVAEKRRHIYPQLAATSVDRILPDRCRAIAGGNVWGPFGRGHIKNSKWRPAYRWQVRSDALEIAATAMLPFLITKEQQARICILLSRATHMGSIKGRYGRPALTDEFKHWRIRLRQAVMALNRRGTQPLSEDETTAIEFARQSLAEPEKTFPHPFQCAA